MPEHPFVDPHVLDRYLAGNATPSEAATVERFLGDARQIRARADLQRSAADVDHDWARLHAQVHAPATGARERERVRRSVPAPHRTRSRTDAAWWIPVRASWRTGAAAAAVVVALFATRWMMSRGSASHAVADYHTGPAEQLRVTLPDGSTVALAPMSRITFDKPFDASSDRTVTLQGQALFTVAHAADAPFVVRTGAILTRVLGTSFAVRRYAQDTATQVVVAQGRVAVGPTVLGTGDIATATSAQQIVVSRNNAVAEELAWTEGRLVFSSIPLRDAIPMLERWYGITVDVDDPALLDRHVTTTLGPEPVARAVELVAFVVEGRATLQGTHAVIHSH